MKKYETDESFLARWIANELSDDELTEFKKTDAYKDFNRINNTAQQFRGPKIDKEAALRKTKAKMQQNGKVRKLSFSVWYAAASIALILGVFFSLNSTKTYTTTSGEQLAVVLPDGSSVKLNANSSLQHKRFFWNNNRKLNLQGEAYFKVKKGSDFTVTTDYGNVTVLGTQFNVKARTHTFELHCYEGKVRFDQKDSAIQKILTKDDQISIIEGTIIQQKSTLTVPNWFQGISVFKERPLLEVLNELSSLYKVTFNTDKINTSLIFSGSFVHNDLEKALKSTLIPMGISYKISESKTIIYLQ